jgi:PadR family transcriptional regulator AphA
MAEIELTTTSFIVLSLLDAASEATPYALKQRAAEQIGDFWSLAHSQLYAEPERLARGGYVTEQREQSGRRRRRYRVTDRGRQAFADWLADPQTGAYDLRDPGLLKLALGADPDRLAAAQLEIHRRRLDEYEAIASALPTEARGGGRALALEAGVGHEREYVRFWSRLTKSRVRDGS